LLVGIDCGVVGRIGVGEPNSGRPIHIRSATNAAPRIVKRNTPLVLIVLGGLIVGSGSELSCFCLMHLSPSCTEV
jgi:hypothetical protein